MVVKLSSDVEKLKNNFRRTFTDDKHRFEFAAGEADCRNIGLYCTSPPAESHTPPPPGELNIVCGNTLNMI